MKSILVTGATGFIGSRLVSDLVEKGYDVSTLVRKGKHVEKKTKEIVGDLTDSDLDFGDNTFDCVFHLASKTPLEKNSKVLEKVNLDGTKNLFNALNGKIKSIVYISGLGVYGSPQETIIDENTPHDPNTNFVKIRVNAENFLRDNCRKNNIKFSVIYFGDVYGSKGWFYEFIVKRLLKNSFRIPGNGLYCKGFVHVDDAVGSMIKIMENELFEESFIVADSSPCTFRDFVNYTADQIGVKHPGTVPLFLARAVLGSELIKLLTTSMQVSNKKISDVYDFKYPNHIEGISNVLSELKQENNL